MFIVEKQNNKIQRLIEWKTNVGGDGGKNVERKTIFQFAMHN